MKQFLLFLAFTIIVGTSVGQTNVYHPFPDSNAMWIQSYWYIDGPCEVSDDFNLYIYGDTTIGTFTYHKLYKNGYMSEFCIPPSIPFPPYYYYGEYFGAFRQDSATKMVYYHEYGYEALAYDFNLNVGDTLPETYFNHFNYVLSIDSVLVGSQYNKRFWLSDGVYDNYAALIEGVGSTLGAFSYLGTSFEYGSNLWCMKINNQIIYTIDSTFSCTEITQVDKTILQNQFSIFPNPFSSYTILKGNVELKNANLEIYNTFGQEVKSLKNISGQIINIHRDNLPCGVYLIRLTQENKIITQEKVIISN